MKTTPIISLEELTVGYPDKTVLSGINMRLSAGKLVCFMGPNGAGKSTLLRTMCQLMPPLAGSIRIQGKPLQEWSRQELARHLSVVLTDRLNAGQLTGREMVAAGRYPYTNWSGRLSREDWLVVDQAMEKTGTSQLSERPFYEMSDGQRQKIMITRALCQETPVIILDEPTAHLDLNNRVAIVNLLKELAHNEQRAILMATHELDLALQLADELWLAETGGSVLEGIPEDLVLDGSLDRVFEFKGYDLKTGSVHPNKSGRKVSLAGEGYMYLWTKNALERNGYEIVANTEPQIRVAERGQDAPWTLQDNSFRTVRDLLSDLDAFFNRHEQAG